MEYVEGDTLANLIARAVQRGPPAAGRSRPRASWSTCSPASRRARALRRRRQAARHRPPRRLAAEHPHRHRRQRAADRLRRGARPRSKLSTTRTGQLKGKLAYMAPEQARGAPRTSTGAPTSSPPGVVLWEALEGRRLFKGDGEADTLNKVLYEPIPPLQAAEPTVPHQTRGRSRGGSRSRSQYGASRRPPRSQTRSSGPRTRSTRSPPTRTWPPFSTRFWDPRS